MFEQSDTAPLTAIQVRMARSGAALTIRDLAEITGLNKATIVRIEAGQSIKPTTLEIVKKALEDYGAVFLNSEQDGKVSVSFISK